jgi:uncharacterized protein YndB with AHSA1/START domain
MIAISRRDEFETGGADTVVTVDYDVAIQRSPEDVFAYITRVEEFADWQREAGLTGVRRTTPGPIGLGSRFVLERQGRRGRTAHIDCEVTAFEPGRRFTFHGKDSDGFDSDFDTTLRPTANGTDLQWRVQMRPPNLLMRLMQPMIRREILRSAGLDFPTLKARLEQPDAVA